MSRKNKAQSILSFFLLVITFFTARSFVLASDVVVTARIPDTQAPSVPILISPADGALLSNNKPAFQWYESFDNVAMFHYEFYLNGSIVYDNIPLVATENSYYSLEYDDLNGIYTLTPKNSLSDRAYTWKIVAVDYANLSSSSDVWDFTIDTLAPNFVLTKIGDTNVNISAGNVGSVPTEPIIIFRDNATANEPVLIAYGEANSEVKLTVTIPGDATQYFTRQINESGSYELQLGILPRNKDIRLDFIITDRVSHVSVLEGVYFRIELQYWPTASPTPSPTPTTSISPSPSSSVSPTPSITTKPSISVSLSPSVTVEPTITVKPSVVPQPSGIIPIIPPKEIVHEIGDELIELLPEPTADSIRTFLRSELWSNLAPVLGLLFLLGFYMFSFLLLLSKFVLDLSFDLLKKLLFLLFPTFLKAKKNLVFEYRDTTASPLVKVELLDENNRTLDFAITNLQGNFDDFNKPQGKWRLQVKDNNFYYPIGDQKPVQLEFWQFYQNQLFDETNYHHQAILIPTLRAAGQEKLPFFDRLRIFILYLLDYPSWFLVSSFLFGLVLFIRYEGFCNALAVLFYIIVFLYKVFFLDQKAKTLVIISKLNGQQQLNDNLIISLSKQNGDLAQSLVMPFEFSRSQPIKHSFTDVDLTAFSKNFALSKDEVLLNRQSLSLAKEYEAVYIPLKNLLEKS